MKETQHTLPGNKQAIPCACSHDVDYGFSPFSDKSTMYSGLKSAEQSYRCEYKNKRTYFPQFIVIS